MRRSVIAGVIVVALISSLVTAWVLLHSPRAERPEWKLDQSIRIDTDRIRIATRLEHPIGEPYRFCPDSGAEPVRSQRSGEGLGAMEVLEFDSEIKIGSGHSGWTSLPIGGYASLQPDAYCRWYPAPEDRIRAIRFRWEVDVPADWNVVGFARAVPGKPTEQGRVRWLLERQEAIPHHSVILIAGKVESRDLPGAPGVPSRRVHRIRSESPFPVERIQRVLSKIIPDAQELFRDLGLPEYDLAVVPDFEPGAMENFGLITLTEDLFRESGMPANWPAMANFVILHEWIHRLVGNCLYPEKPEQIFFVEGLTQFLAEDLSAGKPGYVNPFARPLPEGFRIEIGPDRVESYFSPAAYRFGADRFRTVEQKRGSGFWVQELRRIYRTKGCGSLDYRSLDPSL